MPLVTALVSAGVFAAGGGVVAAWVACFGTGGVSAVGEGVVVAGAACFGTGGAGGGFAGADFIGGAFADGAGFGTDFIEGAGGDVGWFAASGTDRLAYADGGGSGAGKALCLGTLLLSILRLRINPRVDWLLAAVHLAGHAVSISSVDLRE